MLFFDFKNNTQVYLMARANRYILPRQLYHITHRCHNRTFLFRFAKDRSILKDSLRGGGLVRDSKWTESLAVGDKEFVESLKERFSRRRLTISESFSPERNAWTIREERASYS